MQRYIAVVHKDKNSAYGVMLPDFPGCIASGDTVEAALDDAREALAFHAEGMRIDGETIPAPRSLEQIQTAGEAWVDLAGGIIAFVTLIPARDTQERVNVMIDRNLLAATDARAKATSQTRSALISRALQNLLGA